MSTPITKPEAVETLNAHTFTRLDSPDAGLLVRAAENVCGPAWASSEWPVAEAVAFVESAESVAWAPTLFGTVALRVQGAGRVVAFEVSPLPAVPAAGESEAPRD